MSGSAPSEEPTDAGVAAPGAAVTGAVATEAGPSAVADIEWMRVAVAAGESVRRRTSPNPWVGAVLVPAGATGPTHFVGATAPVGGPHAEVGAIAAARAANVDTRGATLYVTLEPCSHHGRTPPCVDAVIAAGIARVVVGVADPDPKVQGRGIAALRAQQIHVEYVMDIDQTTALQVAESLRAYLAQRRTGRPWVVAKVASSLDGRSAAADGSSQWITGAEARADAHEWRADSDAIVVGVGTVRADNPRLTARPGGVELAPQHQPRRVVLGRPPAEALVNPCTVWTRDDGSVRDLLDRLGAEGVLQVLVEGGPAVVGEWHEAGVVDEYLCYVAPALLGGGGRPALGFPGGDTIDEMWRGRFVDIRQIGEDLRVIVRPRPHASAAGEV